MPEAGPDSSTSTGSILRTVDLARAAGVHENTVRLYVQWGFLAEPGRGPNGYRLWKTSHLDQMIFARQAIHGSWPGHRIRKSVLALVRRAAGGDLAGALADALAHEILVDEELARAEAAAAFLDGWARGVIKAADDDEWFTPRQAAEAVGATMDQIRNWERNRLVDTPRDPDTGHRVYSPDGIGRLRVIRALLLAGYSVAAVLRMTTALDRSRKTGLGKVLNTLRPGEEALTAFDRWLVSLAEQKARATGLVQMLEARVALNPGIRGS
jgi:DNA-binding transcriptional MerR regulator